jgi:hypothetical protein
MPFDQRAFNAQYIRENITQKKVVFNAKNKRDRIILDYIEKNIGNFSEHVKALIEAEMNKSAE